MVPRLALKVVEALLPGTVTAAGTVNAALLLEIATVLPPEGVAWLRVTVQVEAEPELTLLGLQATAETNVGATRLTVAVCIVPFKLAATVAVWLVVRAPEVATKVAEVAPAGTATEVGMVNRGLLSDSATVVADEMASFKFTVQVVEPPAVTVLGLQLNDARPSGKTVIVPLVPVV
jgi:hypothetical protein